MLISDICKKYGYRCGSIRRLLLRNKINTKRPKSMLKFRSPQGNKHRAALHKDEIIADYKTGLAKKEIADKYGFKCGAISELLNKNGLYFGVPHTPKGKSIVKSVRPRPRTIRHPFKRSF